jgi:hypothetical protein
MFEGLPLLGAEDHRTDVAASLQGLGLERYVPAFRDNEIEAGRFRCRERFGRDIITRTSHLRPHH